MEKRKIHYEDYGAIGDGVADDSLAIRRAHEAANECGLSIEGKNGATYRIGQLDTPIVIRTETDWNGAHLIFDDHQIPWYDAAHRYTNVFSVEPDKAPYSLPVPEGMQLSKGQANVGITFDEACILKVENSNEKIYRRYGENANGGVNKGEMIIVDKNGDVDPSTPLQYDYTAVTKITVYSLNETPISVGNGTITTIAPNPKALYHILLEGSFIATAISIVIGTTTIADIFVPHTFVPLSVGIGHCTLTVTAPIFELSLIHSAIGIRAFTTSMRTHQHHLPFIVRTITQNLTFLSCQNVSYDLSIRGKRNTKEKCRHKRHHIYQSSVQCHAFYPIEVAKVQKNPKTPNTTLSFSSFRRNN